MKKILLFLFVLPVMAGCYEDESSESHKPISNITIEGIEETYSKMSFKEALKISPTVTSTDPNDELEYLWTIYDADLNETATNVPVDTIGREKDLEWLVNYKPGRYTVVLRVTNTATQPDYVKYATTTLRTNTEFTTGWYILKETASGDTEIDFRNPEGEIISNMIELSTGEVISGAPTRLGYFVVYTFLEPGTTDIVSGAVLVPMGGKDLKMFRTSDMALIYDHESMFYGDEPTETPLMATASGMAAPKYIADIGTYSTSQSPTYGSTGTGKYGFATVPAGGCSYNKNIIVPANAFGSDYINLFDDLNGRFVWISNYTSTAAPLSYDVGGISPNGITDKLLFMSFTHSEYDINTYSFLNYGKAIFQDASNPSQRYVYNLNVGDTHNPIMSITPINPGLNFSKAQVYCTNKLDAPQLMYGGVGDKLYVYNTEDDTEKLLSPKGMAGGEEITMLAYKYDLTDDLLVIATHKDGKYKVYMYTTIGTGEAYGEPVLTAEGVGKIVDMQYASSDRYMGYYYDSNF